MHPDKPSQFLALLGLALCCSVLWADMKPFEARYAIYRNGKLSGKADASWRKQGDLWIMETEGVGTHGLGRILRISDNEYVEGKLRQGRFIPQRYTHHTRVAGIDRGWTATFDWPGETVFITQNSDRDALPLSLENGGLDALSLRMELQRRLEVGDPDMMYFMVDDDQIKQQEYKVLPVERLETSLGCVNTIPVTRLRTNSTRYTRAWHSPDIGYVMVRMEHGKTDGDHMEMRITELQFEGKPVQPLPGCAAMQNNPARP